MADQLRWDYLGCTGHPMIETPTIDALARGGVSFTRAFVQSPVCGGSRMSFYTGRYNLTHGATYNNFPLRIDEKTIGDYLRPLGYRVALVGKTHFKPDAEAMARLGIDPGTDPGVFASQCGFEPFERDDGLHPDQSADPDLPYNRWLRQLGYKGDNPWHDYANSVEGENGEALSGWSMRNAGRPARVKEEHSETAYMTERALSFLDEAEEPWCLHLSYIKPHWPYVAPAPYHAMYGPRDVPPANRSEEERRDPHPVVAAFMAHEESRNFSRDEVRETVIPTYMGLISQFDRHVGRVLAHLDRRRLAEATIVIVTSDHGDYLGDHWLGEKDLFHEEVVRIPLIIADPRPQADAGRGRVSDALVEAIDLVPTFLDWAEGPPEPHRLEGRSLRPLIESEAPPEEWRDAVFCDSDFALRHARRMLGLPPDRARGYMVRTARWKYVFFEDFPPQLFDLEADPKEQNDLGRAGRHDDVLAAMERRLFAWFRARKTRVTVTLDHIERMTGKAKERGYLFGVW